MGFFKGKLTVIKTATEQRKGKSTCEAEVGGATLRDHMLPGGSASPLLPTAVCWALPTTDF